MKNWVATKFLGVLLALAVSLPSGACGFVGGLFTSDEVSLEYVGKIKFGSPLKKGAVTHIPITFEGGKWLENSGISLKKIKASRKGFEIYITVVTCLAGNDGKKPKHEIRMKNLKTGSYQIFYQNPDGSSIQLQSIEI